MDLELLSIPTLILLTLTSLGLLLISTWRFSLILLAIQYAAAFILIAQNWSIQLAVTFLVAGWIAVAVLGLAAANTSQPQSEHRGDRQKKEHKEHIKPFKHFIASGSMFQLIAAGLVIFAIIYLAPLISKGLPEIKLVYALSGSILIGMGLLKLGFTDQTLMIIIGLLIILSGFEIIYAVIEKSTLIVGLLAVVTLGIAMAGSYLLIAPKIKEQD